MLGNLTDALCLVIVLYDDYFESRKRKGNVGVLYFDRPVVPLMASLQFSQVIEYIGDWRKRKYPNLLYIHVLHAFYTCICHHLSCEVVGLG